MEHIETCRVGKDLPCRKPYKLVIGTQQHWYSGWPGAWCMGCGQEDPQEICLGDGCQCPCHDGQLLGLMASAVYGGK